MRITFRQDITTEFLFKIRFFLSNALSSTASRSPLPEGAYHGGEDNGVESSREKS